MISKLSIILKSQLIYLAIAFGLAICVYWLSSDYRPEGILGALQVFFKFTVIIPYLVGAIIGNNAHNPNDVAFLISLFIQFYLITIFISIIVRRIMRR